MIRVAFAVFIAGCVASAGPAGAACVDAKPKSTQAGQAKRRLPADPCVNLSAVPQISAQVVGREPVSVRKAPGYVEPTPASNDGPTLGLTKPDPGVRPVPTVGYHWSLE